jgi:hypothetical protein
MQQFAGTCDPRHSYRPGWPDCRKRRTARRDSRAGLAGSLYFQFPSWRQLLHCTAVTAPHSSRTAGILTCRRCGRTRRRPRQTTPARSPHVLVVFYPGSAPGATGNAGFPSARAVERSRPGLRIFGLPNELGPASSRRPAHRFRFRLVMPALCRASTSLFFKRCCKQDVDGRDNKPGHDGWMGHCPTPLVLAGRVQRSKTNADWCARSAAEPACEARSRQAFAHLECL